VTFSLFLALEIHFWVGRLENKEKCLFYFDLRIDFEEKCTDHGVGHLSRAALTFFHLFYFDIVSLARRVSLELSKSG
jgi:hypothetical protein